MQSIDWCVCGGGGGQKKEVMVDGWTVMGGGGSGVRKGKRIINITSTPLPSVNLALDCCWWGQVLKSGRVSFTFCCYSLSTI